VIDTYPLPVRALRLKRVLHNSGTRSRGFTLIELLIVIAIIILLVAVFLPTLGMMRELLIKLQCKTNLKKVHNCIMGYASRYGGRLPGFGVDGIYEANEPSPGGTPKGRHLMIETLKDLGAESSYFCCPAHPRYKELQDSAYYRWDDGAYSGSGWSKGYATPGYAFFQYVANFTRHPTGGNIIPNRWATWSRFMDGRFLPERNDSSGNPPLAADAMAIWNNGRPRGFFHDLHRKPSSGSEYDEYCIEPGGGGHTLFLAGDVLWYDWGELEAMGPSYERNNDRYYYFGMKPSSD